MSAPSPEYRRAMLNRLAVLMCVPALLVCAGTATAQSRKIEVVGIGSATAKPQMIVISAKMSSTGESAKDSYAQFQTLKEDVRSAFDHMIFPQLEIHFGGEKIMDAMSMAIDDFGFGMMEEEAFDVAPQFSTQELVELRVTDIGMMDDVVLREMMLEILDRASELNLTFESAGQDMMMEMYYGYGSGDIGIVEYRVNSLQETREEAFRVAMADARERAKLLASLSEGHIGRVLEVSQQMESGGDEESALPALMFGALGSDANSFVGDSISSDAPSNLSLTVQLKVVFELLDE